MAQAITMGSDVFSRILPQIRQYEATTGRKISPQVLEGMLQASFREASGRAVQFERLGLERERIEESKRAARAREKAEKSAARASGITQIASAGLQTAILGKAGFLGTAGTTVGAPTAGAPAISAGTVGGTVVAPAVVGFGLGKASAAIFERRGPRTRAGVASGAVAGAGIGFAFGGPVGAVVGGVIGGVAGYAGANK